MPYYRLADLAGVLIIAWLLAVGGTALHEAGHAFVALLLDFEILEIGVRKLRLSFDYRRPRLHWQPPAPGALGYVHVRPRSLRWLRPRHAAIYASGTAAELLLLPLVFAVAAVARLSTSLVLVLLTCYLWKFVGLGQNGWWGLLGRDGEGLRLCVQGGPEALRRLALTDLRGCARAGMSPAAYPDQLIQNALSVCDGTSTELQARIFAYLQAADRGAWVIAREQIRAMLPLLPRASLAAQRACLFEAAFCAALVDRDACTARERLHAALGVSAA